MITMNRSDLLTYLKQAIDLETAVLTQKHIISEYDSSAEKRKPVLKLIDVGEKPNQLDYITKRAPGSLALGTFLIIFGIVIILLFCGLALLSDSSGESNPIIWFVVILGVIAIGGGHSLRKEGLEVKEMEEDYANAYNDYYNAKNQAARDNDVLTQQYNVDKQTWANSNTEAHVYLSKPLLETESTLQSLYSKDVIYPKYRNLPALTSIYEYLITGRCEELSGPHGAYNLYEDEIRKDTVISQLNTVIENLEQIRQNQYMLYEQVKGIQQATRAIAVEMYQIKGYTAYLTELTALNTYYNGINAMNSTALAYCRSL